MTSRSPGRRRTIARMGGSLEPSEPERQGETPSGDLRRSCAVVPIWISLVRPASIRETLFHAIGKAWISRIYPLTASTRSDILSLNHKASDWHVGVHLQGISGRVSRRRDLPRETHGNQL